MVVIIRKDDCLEHHGILKQKWGVRHGPPYPLNYEDHSPAQKKANPKSALNNYENNNPVKKDLKDSYKKVKTTGEAIDQHRKNISNLNNKYSDRKALDSFINQENEIYNKKLKDIETSQINKDIAKKVLIGLGATAVVGLAAYGLYEAKQNNDYENEFTKIDLSKLKSNKIQNALDNAQSGMVKYDVTELMNQMQQDGAFGDATVFTNGYYANQYNTERLFDKSQWKALNANEKNGIYNYTEQYYQPMNSILRGIQERNDKYDAMINNCTAGLEKMRLPEDTLCHRGVGSLSSLAKTLGVSESDLSNPSVLKGMVSNGFTYTDPAFFSSGGSTQDAWGGTKIHAFAPKGTKGIYVDPVSSHPGEHEMILQRNTTFKVTNFKTNAHGVVTDVFVEVVAQML